MSELDRQVTRPLPVTVRKLVAIDIVFHGYRFIVAEFCVAILLCTVLGLWAARAGSASQGAGSVILVLVGAYFLSLALNYAVLLGYAIAIARRSSAHEEVAGELAEKDNYAWKYGVRQLLLVVPLVIPALAVTQELRRLAWQGKGMS